MDSRRLIVGLGNPGPKYADHRHNVGFMVIDELASAAGASVSRSKFKSHYATASLEGEALVFLKPQTFMNLSGEAVQPAAKFFQVPTEHILVVHDEIDLPFGTLKLKVGGGHAGHNGLRSIIGRLGVRDFVRLRVGVGRPRHGEVSDFVLSPFGLDEQAWVPDLVERSADAVRRVLADGLRAATKHVNTPPKA